MNDEHVLYLTRKTILNSFALFYIDACIKIDKWITRKFVFLHWEETIWFYYGITVIVVDSHLFYEKSFSEYKKTFLLGRSVDKHY